MSTFVKYQDEIDLTLIAGFVKDGTWRTLDISSVIADPSAKAVTVRFQSDLTRLHGVRELASSVTSLGKTFNNRYCTTVVGLSGGTTFQYNLQDVSDGPLWLTGEIHDHAVIYTTPTQIPIVEAQFGTWITQSPTPEGADVLGDIMAVIVRAICVVNTGDEVGFREKGSGGVATWRMHTLTSDFFFVVGLDSNGEYEIQTPGTVTTDDESVEFYEVGYILKTSDITTIPAPIDMNLPVQSGSFAALDLSAHLPEKSIMFGGWWDNTVTGGSHQSFFRNTGSSEDEHIRVNNSRIITQHCAVDGSLECEYQLLNSGVDFYISWYEQEPSGVPGVGDGNASFNNACDAVAGFGVG